MKQDQLSNSRSRGIPKNAVLLIPEPERAGVSPRYGVEPGYYDKKQMLALLEKHKHHADAIRFIADMLETGDPHDDEFAELLRKNFNAPLAISRLIQHCGNE